MRLHREAHFGFGEACVTIGGRTFYVFQKCPGLFQGLPRVGFFQMMAQLAHGAASIDEVVQRGLRARIRCAFDPLADLFFGAVKRGLTLAQHLPFTWLGGCFGGGVELVDRIQNIAFE